MLASARFAPSEPRFFHPAHQSYAGVAALALTCAACSERSRESSWGVTPSRDGSTDGGTYGPGADGGSYFIDDAGNFYVPGSFDSDGGSGEPIAVDQCGAGNPAQLSPEQVKALQQGGPSAGMRMLYPYAGTVFPRGLLAPELMWEGAAADAVYLHVQGSAFDYKGCLKPSADGTLVLPDAVWKTAGTQTQGADAPYTIELTTLQGATVRGPVKLQIVIARANLSGSIFYNSYNTGGGGVGLPLGGAVGSGAVVRIRPGKQAETFARQGTCTGCHSVSANGSRLIAKELFSLNDGSVYDITPTTAANPSPSRGAAGSAFAGIFPDGSVYVTSAARNGVGPLLIGGAALGATPDTDSVMYETDTGTQVSGSGIPTTAMMPTFSPDGTQLAFNDYAQGAGHALTVMNFDPKARKASSARKVFEHASLYPGWPFSLPDNRALVFALGAEQVFDGNGVGIQLSLGAGPHSDLRIVDLSSGRATLLARAMGFATPADAQADKTYLPFGAEETHQAYYPTVSPVASGGYFWIFFDAMRHYGNKGLKRQLWGSALRVSADGTYDSDPSHPAFYVSGQDLNTANHRAFTALDPCKTDGDRCTSGVDCCGGFCVFPETSSEFDLDRQGTCASTPPKRCAGDADRCNTSADCCDTNQQCINAFCSVVIL